MKGSREKSRFKTRRSKLLMEDKYTRLCSEYLVPIGGGDEWGKDGLCHITSGKETVHEKNRKTRAKRGCESKLRLRYLRTTLLRQEL